MMPRMCEGHTTVFDVITLDGMVLQQIEALQQCHSDNKYAKFWGACNQQKWELDACLRKEKTINRCMSVYAGWHSLRGGQGMLT